MDSAKRSRQRQKLDCGSARQNRINVLATFPSICHRQEYESPTARRVIHDIESFYTSLGVSVVGTAEEAMLPPDLCFDTFYHSTEARRRERSGC